MVNEWVKQWTVFNWNKESHQKDFRISDLSADFSAWTQHATSSTRVAFHRNYVAADNVLDSAT
jgi:hypothetical protein